MREAGDNHDLRRISIRTEILPCQGDLGAKFFAENNNVRLTDQSAEHNFGPELLTHGEFPLDAEPFV